MIVERALEAAGITELVFGNAPPVKQRGAKYWGAFIDALQKLGGDLECELHQARMEVAELRIQLKELQTSPLEMLLCRARQGREQLEQTYRQLALRLHPDHGGNCAAFQQLQADYEQALQLFTVIMGD